MSIKLENVSYYYNKGNVYETLAVDDVSFEIKDGEFVGVIGHTGSGKSTMVQLLNCLLKPSSGRVIVDGKDVNENENTMRENRFKVGMVFQYPEHQLFEMTVLEDVCFGPRNMNLDEDEVRARAKKWLGILGVDESLYDKGITVNRSHYGAYNKW